ncbi:MAG: hypothetical protein H6Q75_573 [Firmicutes bacterium]|nr:hypothetical protein [Bacillota bacterium]
MAPNLMVGIVGEAAETVTEENTADKFGNQGARVFATPMMVALMEQAAIAAVSGYLADDEGTVGTKVDVSHLAATPIGMTVRAVAKLVAIEGKKLVFEVEAWDEIDKIGEGRHERFVINTVKFYNKVEAKVK